MRLIEDFKTPSITRIQYANLRSQEVWGEKIRRAGAVYPSLEFLTVKHGIRKCMIHHNVNPYELEYQMRELSRQGLVLVPLEKEGFGNGSGFGHVSHGYNGDGNYVYRSVIARNIQDASEFAQAHVERDDVKIGELLGFPRCCSEFFDNVWKQGYFDPIWQQAENTRKPEIVKNRRGFEDGPESTEKKIIRLRATEEGWKALAVFRYIGVRLISHFACSFECEHSVKVANDWIQLGRDLNIEGLDEALEILQLPFEWDCSKGFAVVNTPVFKIVTNSMPAEVNHIIQQESDFYPEEAPTGLQFPWKFPWGEKC